MKISVWRGGIEAVVVEAIAREDNGGTHPARQPRERVFPTPRRQDVGNG